MAYVGRPIDRGIPWSAITSSSATNSIAPGIVAEKTNLGIKTFAAALTGTQLEVAVDLQNLPKPCVMGDEVCIKIFQDDSQAGLDRCKLRLQGRIFSPKGTVPPKLLDLRNQLNQIWKLSSQWSLVSLGKGFFEFFFQSPMDLQKVRTVSSWNLSPGNLRIFSWTRDFSPYTAKQTNAQVWIKIHGVPQEYWSPRVLFSIASSVGTPICLDDATNKSCSDIFDPVILGHFARVLVDIALDCPLRYQVRVERDDFAFFTPIEYERLPDFCSHCKTIGHGILSCRHLSKEDLPVVSSKAQHKSDFVKKKQLYVPKQNVLSVHNVPLAASSGLSVGEKDLIKSNLGQDKDTGLSVTAFFPAGTPEPVQVQKVGSSTYNGKFNVLESEDAMTRVVNQLPVNGDISVSAESSLCINPVVSRCLANLVEQLSNKDTHLSVSTDSVVITTSNRDSGSVLIAKGISDSTVTTGLKVCESDLPVHLVSAQSQLLQGQNVDVNDIDMSSSGVNFSNSGATSDTLVAKMAPVNPQLSPGYNGIFQVLSTAEDLDAVTDISQANSIVNCRTTDVAVGSDTKTKGKSEAVAGTDFLMSKTTVPVQSSSVNFGIPNASLSSRISSVNLDALAHRVATLKNAAATATTLESNFQQLERGAGAGTSSIEMQGSQFVADPVSQSVSSAPEMTNSVVSQPVLDAMATKLRFLAANYGTSNTASSTTSDSTGTSIGIVSDVSTLPVSVQKEVKALESFFQENEGVDAHRACPYHAVSTSAEFLCQFEIVAKRIDVLKSYAGIDASTKIGRDIIFTWIQEYVASVGNELLANSDDLYQYIVSKLVGMTDYTQAQEAANRLDGFKTISRKKHRNRK